MPRVLRIFNRMIVGGPVLNASFLTRYLAPEFETIMVVGPKEAHEQDANYLAKQLGIAVLTIPEMGRSVNPFSDAAAYRKLRQLMQKFDPHIVHTHAAKPGALGRMAAASLQVPAIVHTYHGHVFHSYFNRFKTGLVIEAERWLARRTHAIVAISKQQKQELVEDFRIAPASKFHLIRLGLDLDKFGQDGEAKRALFRNAYSLAPDEIAIGIIGRLVPVKNHTLFLEALHHVLQHSRRKVKAFIVGDGETRTHLELVAQSKGIRYSTHQHEAHPHPLVFTSWRKDVDVVMAGLDIVTLTSFNEGTPVSLIEAQAAGKPIVSTRVGGIQDIVLEGQTALLADIWNKADFSRQLLQLVDDEPLRRQLSANSAAHVLQRYGYRRLVQEMGDLYYQLLHQKKKHVFFPEENIRTADLSWLGADIHAHLLPGIDDGAQELNTSLELVRGLVELGYKKLVATPHVLWEVYPNTPEIISAKLSALKTAASQAGIAVELHAAAEYFIDDYLIGLLDQKAPLLSLHKNLVLVEFSMATAPFDLQQIFFDMQLQGYQPVLAHPERYIYLSRRKEVFDSLWDAGVFFQLNLLSLAGYYGRSVQDLAYYLIENGCYHLAGTDLHTIRQLEALEKFAASDVAEWLKDHPFRNKELVESGEL